MENFIGTFLTVRDRNNMKSPVDCIRPLFLHALNFPLLFFLSQKKTFRYISECDVCYVDGIRRLRNRGRRCILQKFRICNYIFLM